MARVGLGLSNQDLAKASGVGVNTVSRFEQGADIRLSNAVALRGALESAGAVFLSDGEVSSSGGFGVRLQGAK